MDAMQQDDAGERRQGAIVLEMLARPQLIVTRPHRSGMLLLLDEASVSFYRFLHSEAGTPRSRAVCLGSEEETFARLIDPEVDVFVLFLGGAPAGFFELDRRTDAQVEIVHTGLVPDFQGRGLGKYLVATAVDAAWDGDPRRVWTSVDGEDDPRGLLLYQWAGFVPVTVAG